MNASPLALVVAYHGHMTLDACLDSIPGGTPVTVVDNSSSAEVRRVALARSATYIDSGANLGFAGGVNRGLRDTWNQEDVLLITPDATLEAGTLALLTSELRAPGNERVAAVAPVLRDSTGYEQRVSWPFPTPARAWLEALGLGRYGVAQQFMIGAVLLLRYEALRDVGLFDERFFLYAEETDWQRRAVACGWRSLQCKRATALHVGAGSSTDDARREVLFHAAHEIYIRKWFGRTGWFVYRTGVISGSIARGLVLRGSRQRAAWTRIRLYIRGPLRCARSSDG